MASKLEKKLQEMEAKEAAGAKRGLSDRDQERLSSLKAVREESLKLGDTPEGKAYRSVVMLFASMMIVFVILLLFNLVTGRGVSDIVAIVTAAFAGLSWAQYRETSERAMGWYAIAAGVCTAAMVVLHVFNIF